VQYTWTQVDANEYDVAADDPDGSIGVEPHGHAAASHPQKRATCRRSCSGGAFMWHVARTITMAETDVAGADSFTL
jgi:hypothetical protein